MKHKTHLLVGLALSVLPSIAGAAPVAGIDALKQWNLVVLGNLDSQSAVAGRTFVGGNLSGVASRYNVAPGADAGGDGPGLTVVGSVTGNAKSLANGSGAVVGGNVSSGFVTDGSPQTIAVGGSIAGAGGGQATSGLAKTDANFSNALLVQKDVLTNTTRDLSAAIGAQPVNSRVAVANGVATFNATPDSNKVAVFDVAAADLSRFGKIDFRLNGTDTAIVNVHGTNVRLGAQFARPAADLGGHVIWNFPEATQIAVTKDWIGSVLAPYANGQILGTIKGSAVFAHLVLKAWFLHELFKGSYKPPVAPPTGGGGGTSPIPVPEPGAIALFAAGAGVLMLMRRRRRRTA